MSGPIPTFELQDPSTFHEVSLQDEKKRANQKSGVVFDRRIWIAVVGVIGVMAVVGIAIGATMGAAGADDILADDRAAADTKMQHVNKAQVIHNGAKVAQAIHEKKEAEKRMEERIHHVESVKHHSSSRLAASHVKEARADICLTPECSETANTLIASLNKTVNPCDDFYEFACGGWVADHPNDMGSQGTFYEADDLLQSRLTVILESDVGTTDPTPLADMRVLYNSCMDTDAMNAQGLAPLIAELTKVGGWPMTLDNWDNATYSVEEAIAGVQKLRIGPLISVGNDADYLNTSTKILYIVEGNLGFNSRYLLNETEYSDEITAYKKYIGDSAKLVRDAAVTGVTDASIDVEVEAMVAFEIELAKVMDAVVFHNFSNDLEYMTVAELQTLFDSGATDQFNWLNYLRVLFTGTTVNIDDTEPTYVIMGSYMPELAILMSNTPPRTLANYFGWFWTMVTGIATTDAMRTVGETFDQTVYGSTPNPDRTQHCVNQVNYNLGFATSRAYVDDYFHEEDKAELQLLVEKISESFNELINETDWMLEEDKVKAMEKLAAIERNVAYPDWMMDDALLTAAYSGLDFVLAMQYGNLMNLADVIREADLSTFRDEPMTAFSGSPPTVVNAYYDVFSNSINILVGILQSPFYAHNSLYAVNFGAIGLVVGHEFTHGFDNNGRRFDKNGNYDLWWSQETTDNFLNKSQCFVDQYDDYYPPELMGTQYENMHVDGQQTLGENIADNGGIREAFKAYRKLIDDNFGGVEENRLPGLDEYTPNQLFFIGFANVWCEHRTISSQVNQLLGDPHSPGMFRVIGSVSNDEDFRQTWSCDDTTEMNRGDETCVLW